MIRDEPIDKLADEIMDLISKTEDITIDEIFIAVARIPGYILYTLDEEREEESKKE